MLLWKSTDDGCFSRFNNCIFKCFLTELTCDLDSVGGRLARYKWNVKRLVRKAIGNYQTLTPVTVYLDIKSHDMLSSISLERHDQIMNSSVFWDITVSCILLKVSHCFGATCSSSFVTCFMLVLARLALQPWRWMQCSYNTLVDFQHYSSFYPRRTNST